MRKATEYHGFPPINEEECKELIRLGQEEDGYFISLEGESIILGFLAPMMYNSEVIYAREIFWYSEKGCPNGLKVFKQFQEWAESYDIKGIIMSITDKTPFRIADLYESEGYTMRGADFIKEF